MSVKEEVENVVDMKVWFDVDEKKVDLVNKWVFEGEWIIYGCFFGIDNIVSSFGKIFIMCLLFLYLFFGV